MSKLARPRRVLFVLRQPTIGPVTLYRSARRAMENLAEDNVPFMPALGAAYLAAAARTIGHAVSLVEVGDLPEGAAALRSAVREFEPDVVGMTCLVQDGAWSLAAARCVKAVDARITTILGGPQAAAFAEEFARDPAVDAVALGEGEITLCEVLQRLGEPGSLAKVRGLCVKGGSGGCVRTPPRPLVRDLDRLPMPAMDLYGPGSRVVRLGAAFRNGAMSLLSARGCPYGCRYCASHTVWGRGYRAHGVERVVSEMNRWHRDYGFMNFLFYDDIFTVDRERTLRLCAEIVRSRAEPYIWSCGTRADRVDRELLKTMREAGCTFVSYGIESGSQRLLDAMSKGMTVEQNRQAVELSRKAGLGVGASFLVGLPTETEEETDGTIRMARELGLDFANFAIYLPLGGSVLWPEAMAAGSFVKSSVPGAGKVWVPKGRSRRELEGRIQAANRAFAARKRGGRLGR